MSNRRVPFIVGNTFRRDHHIWPTKTRQELIELEGGTVGQHDIEQTMDERYPVGLDLDHVMALMWRVQEWTVDSVSLTAQGNAVDGPVPDVGNFAVWDLTWDTAETKLHTRVVRPSHAERDTVDESDQIGPWDDFQLPGDFFDPPGIPPPAAVWKTNRNRGIKNTDPVADAGALSSFFFRASPAHPPFGNFTDAQFLVRNMAIRLAGGYVMYDTTTKLHYPPLALDFAISVVTNYVEYQDVVFLANLLPVTRTVVPTHPDRTYGVFTLDIPGLSEVDIPLGHNLRVQTQAEIDLGMVDKLGSFSLDVTATKFNQFFNSLGQLCFDLNTGAQIADPHA